MDRLVAESELSLEPDRFVRFMHLLVHSIQTIFPLKTTIDPSSADTRDSIMVRRLPRTCKELLLLLELNHSELRHDPWNPTPHILCAVERGDEVYLCMEPLIKYNLPPFRTVANYIDFFRQTLEVYLRGIHVPKRIDNVPGFNISSRT